MQHSRFTLAFKPLILLPPTSYLLPPYSHHLMLLSVFLHFLLLISPLTLSNFFNEMLAVSEPGALNYYISFRLIPLTLFASRNLNLIHLPLSGYLDSLFYHLIAPNPGLAFFPNATHASGGIIISSGRAYPSLNFLLPFFSLLDPYSVYIGVNISLNNSFLLSFLSNCAPPICSSPTDSRTFSPSFRNLINKVLRGKKYSMGSSHLTSSPSITLTYLLLSIVPLAFASPLNLLCFLLYRPLCSWEVLQDLGCDHLQILLTIFLFAVF